MSPFSCFIDISTSVKKHLLHAGRQGLQVKWVLSGAAGELCCVPAPSRLAAGPVSGLFVTP